MEHSNVTREAFRDVAVRDVRHGVDRKQSYSKPVKGVLGVVNTKGLLITEKWLELLLELACWLQNCVLPAGRLLVYQGVTVGCAATEGTLQ